MKEKKIYKRSYKNLVNVFLVLVMLALSEAINCLAGYAGVSGMKAKFIILIIVEVIANVIFGEALTYLAITGFNKYSSENIMSQKKSRIVFAVVSALVAFVITMLNVICICCMMYYGKLCC